MDNFLFHPCDKKIGQAVLDTANIACNFAEADQLKKEIWRPNSSGV